MKNLPTTQKINPTVSIEISPLHPKPRREESEERNHLIYWKNGYVGDSQEIRPLWFQTSPP